MLHPGTYGFTARHLASSNSVWLPVATDRPGGGVG
jgi:hypothetical protein